MAWRKVPQENVELLANIVRAIPEAELRPMFGCPAYFINGNMFVGAHQEYMILRLSPADREEILQRDDVVTFTPMAGRPMKEYVIIPAVIFSSEAAFLPWLQKSRAYVSALPVKEAKVKKRK